jgi:hypothetical protein
MNNLVYWAYWYALNKEELEFHGGVPNKIKNAYAWGPDFVWVYRFGMPYTTSDQTNEFIAKYRVK